MNTTEMSNDNTPKMKKYNQSIQVKIEVDAIAQKLLDSLDAKNPARVLIAETMIDITLAQGNGISHLYNALMGFDTNIYLKVGTDILLELDAVNKNRWDKGFKASVIQQGMFSAKVLDVNKFRDYPVNVEYSYVNEEGETRTETTWVQLKSIGIPTEEV
jgi:hypothetical protein